MPTDELCDACGDWRPCFCDRMFEVEFEDHEREEEEGFEIENRCPECDALVGQGDEHGSECSHV